MGALGDVAGEDAHEKDVRGGAEVPDLIANGSDALGDAGGKSIFQRKQEMLLWTSDEKVIIINARKDPGF
jgi:hypothetical protein